MEERISLSKEEIQNICGKWIINISETWNDSYFYYDNENDRFIESRYHEEYLDTGTVFEGYFVVSDEYLWNRLVKNCNENGMKTFMKYRSEIPEPVNVGERITMDDFCNRMNALNEKENQNYRYEKIGSFYIVIESNTVLCILKKSESYCSLYNPKSDVRNIGFQLLEEALAYALEIIYCYNNYYKHNNSYNCKERKHDPKTEQLSETITMNEFHKGIVALRQEKPWRCYYCDEINSTIVIRNETDTILGILGIVDDYYFYFDPYSNVKCKKFQNLGEGLARALKEVTFYHNNRVECNDVHEQMFYATEKPVSKPTEHIPIETVSTSTETPTKKSLLARLFGK